MRTGASSRSRSSVGGLVASFFHLGRPERAWRTAAQWRTSWLSREVIVLPALMAAVFAFGVAHLTGWRPVLVTLPSGVPIDVTIALGIAGTLLAFALYLCTAMIYACLPFLREWATPLTVVNYTLLGAASGFTLGAAFAAWQAPELTRFLAGWAIVLTLLGFASRAASLVRNHRLKPNRLCRRRSASSTRASCRRRWASWAARSTPASSSTAARSQCYAPSNGDSRSRLSRFRSRCSRPHGRAAGPAHSCSRSPCST